MSSLHLYAYQTLSIDAKLIAEDATDDEFWTKVVEIEKNTKWKINASATVHHFQYCLVAKQWHELIGKLLSRLEPLKFDQKPYLQRKSNANEQKLIKLKKLIRKLFSKWNDRISRYTNLCDMVQMKHFQSIHLNERVLALQEDVLNPIQDILNFHFPTFKRYQQWVYNNSTIINVFNIFTAVIGKLKELNESFYDNEHVLTKAIFFYRWITSRTAFRKKQQSINVNKNVSIRNTLACSSTSLCLKLKNIIQSQEMFTESDNVKSDESFKRVTMELNTTELVKKHLDENMQHIIGLRDEMKEVSKNIPKPKNIQMLTQINAYFATLDDVKVMIQAKDKSLCLYAKNMLFENGCLLGCLQANFNVCFV